MSKKYDIEPEFSDDDSELGATNTLRNVLIAGLGATAAAVATGIIMKKIREAKDEIDELKKEDS